MNDADARSITNSFQDVRLVSLSSWSKAAEIQPRDKAGPYVALQAGYDPMDPSLSFDEFILGRSGRWLSLGHFYRLPVEDRRLEFVFGTAAEVIGVLRDLPSKAIIIQPGDKTLNLEAEPATDEMTALIRPGKDGAAASE